MSYSIDVNILPYSSDTSSRFHERVLASVESCANSAEPLFLAYLTLMSYVRIATHPRIFTNPLTPGEALVNIEKLAELPQTRLVSERDGFLELYDEVTQDFSVRANLAPTRISPPYFVSTVSPHSTRVTWMTLPSSNFSTFGIQWTRSSRLGDGVRRAVGEEEAASNVGVNVRVQRRPERLDDGNRTRSSLGFVGCRGHHLAGGFVGEPRELPQELSMVLRYPKILWACGTSARILSRSGEQKRAAPFAPHDGTAEASRRSSWFRTDYGEAGRVSDTAQLYEPIHRQVRLQREG